MSAKAKSSKPELKPNGADAKATMTTAEDVGTDDAWSGGDGAEGKMSSSAKAEKIGQSESPLDDFFTLSCLVASDAFIPA